MQQLPYELLQQISSSLLPRYQCRFALTSKHHYKYLYTPLLKWHARKDSLLLPRYHVINDELSVRGYNGRLICNSMRYYMFSVGDVNWYVLMIFNLSNCTYTHVDTGTKYNTPRLLSKNLIKSLQMFHPISIFDKFYKYMCRDIFVSFASVRLSPLLCLPKNILAYIKYKTYKDMSKILGPEVHQCLIHI